MCSYSNSLFWSIKVQLTLLEAAIVVVAVAVVVVVVAVDVFALMLLFLMLLLWACLLLLITLFSINVYVGRVVGTVYKDIFVSNPTTAFMLCCVIVGVVTIFKILQNMSGIFISALKWSYLSSKDSDCSL